jgi:glycogen operon protein
MIEAGNPHRLGAQCDGQGANFAIFSASAEAVELCLVDADGRQSCFSLPHEHEGVWHGYLPGCQHGQRYGYRVHGPWEPESGLRSNPSKFLIDPYARALQGSFRWSGAIYDYDRTSASGSLRPNLTDSMDYMPRCLVSGPDQAWPGQRPRIPWTETVIYEANVRGYTMAHPDIPGDQRGKFRGMSNGRILDYLKALGITSLELMPVHEMVDEGFLIGRDLRNFWGYNSINYFTPEQTYAGPDAVMEFREMVNAIHDAGIEVILDVVYNHTAEGDGSGPTFSFRGIDNLSYYRTDSTDPSRYINDTGCGNTVNCDHPRVQNMIVDSLVYWHRCMGVDGFRFDLAPVLGRTMSGFDPNHVLLHRINDEPALSAAKLIAEPWDPGPGGYQLGQFPSRWAEWNDDYRDTVRRFWRGDQGQMPAMARRLHGSADIFEAAGRPPQASINFVTAHDGFTLMDLVSYENRHNEANGEANRDGHQHNFSCNYGVEGETRDAEINRLRRQQRMNLLATLLLSKGTPMLLAGDEFGNSQKGNNNAYAQDNETGWLDWHGLQADAGFPEQVRKLIALRGRMAHTRRRSYAHGVDADGDGWRDIEWLRPGGARISEHQWQDDLAMTVLFPESDESLLNETESRPGDCPAVAIMMNASHWERHFKLPGLSPDGSWEIVFNSTVEQPPASGPMSWMLPPQTIVCAMYRGQAGQLPPGETGR